jgi:ABC-type transport system involved in multi-copper enzyme maturation permease subunit
LFEEAAELRLVILTFIIPAGCAIVCIILFVAVTRRLLHPPDVGAEAQEVVDPDLEQRQAMGMVIRSDQFPDRLFAPAKRTDMMLDGLNPVFDKEMRSELFGQGTLMLRLVIQLSMFLALPLMAACMYMAPRMAPWYASYVVLFNMLVGPVFSAGAVTSERERETLELLLTTILSPWQILSGKLFSGLRISLVLTSFLVWPLLLACLLPPWTYLSDMPTMFGYVAIIALSSLTTTVTALFFSVICRKTSVSMMATYATILLLYAAPLAVEWFARLLFSTSSATAWIHQLTFTSPFAASLSLPLSFSQSTQAIGSSSAVPILANWPVFCGYLAFYLFLNAALLGSILWLFNKRWRVSV